QNGEDKKAKMTNVSLRKAMAYAMNIDAVTKRDGNGVSIRINTLIPAQLGDFSDKSIKGYPYYTKKSHESIDNAGYKKKKSEKYRRQPNGKKLTINVAVRNTQPNAEKIWTNYLQQWQKIGLDAKFVGGRPMEFNSWVQDVQADSPKID